MKKVCSFDVFDTCLTRKVAVPSGVFYEVARKVFAKLGIPPSHANVEDFVAARIEAERFARKQTDREDVTLREIWLLLNRSMGWQSDEAFADCELEAEDECLVPVASLYRDVQSARRAGHRIIFISDMYLPADFVERQLTKHGFAQAGDGIYVSGVIGKTKASGNLFKHALSMEAVSPSMFFHSGDNPHSDFAVPSQLGIQSKLCDPSKLTPTEATILEIDGDIHCAAIAGAMRAFRLQEKAGENKNIRELAAQFVGPFVMGFAAWVLQRAHETGVKRLYFLSRDCQLICKVASELSPQFGGIECHYLYVSRQALFLPSADSISPEGMPWMRRDWEEPVLNKLLAKIELTYENVETSMDPLAREERGGFRLKSARDWTSFWDALNQEPVKTRIMELIATRRRNARDYLTSAGMFENKPWAIVDLGWTLSCQKALWKLLRHCDWPGRIQGFYFGLVKQRTGPEEAGPTDALFYQPAFDMPKSAGVGAVFNRITLLEHIVGCADHPTVHHYEKFADGKTGPAYGDSVKPETLQFCRDLHAQTVEFACQNQSLVETFRKPVVCQKVLAALVPAFFSYPTEGPAGALVGLTATGDQNGLNALPIVESLDWKKALAPLMPKTAASLKKWRQSDTSWPEGSIVITPSRVRQVSMLARRAANRLANFRGKLWHP